MAFEDIIICLTSFFSALRYSLLWQLVYEVVSPTDNQLVSMEILRVTLKVKYFNYLILRVLHQRT